MRAAMGLALVLGACAPALVLPPPAVPTEEWRQPLTPPPVVRAPSPDAPLVRHDFDSTLGYTRRLVLTHPGVYTGWVQKPQVSFFALTPGVDPPRFVPASIGLIVRTLEPSAVTGPRLILQCPSAADTVEVALKSHVSPTGNTHSHFLTYLLPTERVSVFANCPEGVMSVGQSQVRFTEAQISGIRALLLELGAAQGPETR